MLLCNPIQERDMIFYVSCWQQILYNVNSILLSTDNKHCLCSQKLFLSAIVLHDCAKTYKLATLVTFSPSCPWTWELVRTHVQNTVKRGKCSLQHQSCINRKYQAFLEDLWKWNYICVWSIFKEVCLQQAPIDWGLKLLRHIQRHWWFWTFLVDLFDCWKHRKTARRII